MDNDLSHEALQRFEAIEARLDKLEGNGSDTDESATEEEGETEEETTPEQDQEVQF